MKIDQNVISLPAATAEAGRARTIAGSPATAVSASPSATVSTRLQAAAGGEFDAGRVARIREAIASGTYRIDAGRIADGLLDSVRDLLGGPR